eukprot:m.211633 g.211633  ORF g.211633 m.211633 type:complete len:483 (+) comp15841_c0_seq3:59-1507(+)
MVTLSLSLLASCALANLGEKDIGMCKFVKDSKKISWLRCDTAFPGKGNILSLGVNHVENCDRTLLEGNTNCPPGSYGPLRNTTELGLVCPWFCNSYDLNFNASAYYLSTIDRYGNTSTWAQNSLKRLMSWGFNTIGSWSSPLLTGNDGALLQPPIHTDSSNMQLYGYSLDMLMTSYEHRFAGEGHLINVFSTEFMLHCARVANERCVPRKNDSRLLGYWIDNETPWNPSSGQSDDMISLALRRLDPNNTAPVTRWLQTRYNNSISALNTAWNIKVENWSDLWKQQPYPKTTARDTDNIDFIEYYVNTYVKVASTAIRAADPNHMILGSRLLPSGGPILDAVVRGAAPYVDCIDVHVYDSDPNVKLLHHLHNVSGGLPILMSEFGFRARDSGLPNIKGAGPLVWTQTQRAAAYKTYIEELVSLPFVIGYHMFMWEDEPAGGQLFHANSNFGLVHLSDDPYEVTTQAFTVINGLTTTWHGNSSY